jgi:hypothetical protein
MELPASGPSVLFEHDDVVESRHRFPSINFRGHAWDLRHLDAFAIRIDPNLGFEIDVIVLFSCHCFTHQVKHDERARMEIPECEIYEDGNERRVLSKDRYELSRRFLPGLVKEFSQRHIRFGRQHPQNFFTAECADVNSTPGMYVVFFELARDKKRKQRVLLHIQSAYWLQKLPRRLESSRKVRFATLLKAAYNGTFIHG